MPLICRVCNVVIEGEAYPDPDPPNVAKRGVVHPGCLKHALQSQYSRNERIRDEAPELLYMLERVITHIEERHPSAIDGHMGLLIAQAKRAIRRCQRDA